MSSELIQRQGQPMALQEKLTYAEKLAASGLIPDAYKRNPPNVLVAVEKGEALGIHPIMALEEINVINGRASLSATLMASLARAAGHVVRTHSEPEQATCIIIRSDDPKFEHKVVWDRKIAEDHGLWGKGHWKKNPALMLEYRAISQCIRKACPEVLAGIKYTPEELVEIAEEDRPAPQPQRSTRPAPTQEPPQEGDPIADRIDSCLASDNAQQVHAFGKWLANNAPDHPRLAEVRAHYESLAPEQATEPEQTAIDGEIIEEDQS